MSSHIEQYPEEPYRTQDVPRDGDRPDGRLGDRCSTYLPAWDWGGASGLRPWASRGPDGSETGNGPRQETGAGDGRLASVQDEGLIALLIVVGAVLFVNTEPATSALGVVLVALGVLTWLVDQMT